MFVLRFGFGAGPVAHVVAELRLDGARVLDVPLHVVHLVRHAAEGQRVPLTVHVHDVRRDEAVLHGVRLIHHHVHHVEPVPGHSRSSQHAVDL